MKKRPLKIMLIALTLPLVTSCTILDNVLGMVALNAVFDSEIILNRASFASGSLEIEQFDKQPIYVDEHAALTYGLDALIVPDSVSIKQMGFTIDIDFEVTFSEGSEDFFYTEVVAFGDEEGEEETSTATGNVIYPVGTVSKPTSFDTIEEWITLERLSAFKKEADRTFSLNIKGKSGNKTKSRTFYFSLSGKTIEIPGDGEIDFEEDYLLVVEDIETPTALEVTIAKDSLEAGHAVPLQIVWYKPGEESFDVGILTISVEILGDDSDNFEVITSEPYDNISITKIKKLIEWPNTIKLKSGKTPPSADLVVRYTATIVLA